MVLVKTVPQRLYDHLQKALCVTQLLASFSLSLDEVEQQAIAEVENSEPVERFLTTCWTEMMFQGKQYVVLVKGY